MPSDVYDVIVVGGGPAGTAFARTAANLGAPLRILVVDKAVFPRDKACGDALTYKAVPLLREIFPELEWPAPAAGAPTRQVLFYPRGQVLQRDTTRLDVIPRAILDAALWRSLAAAGVETLAAAEVKEVVFEAGRAVGVRAASDGAIRELRCRWLLGADGSRSVVRAQTGPIDRDRVIWAVRQYVCGVDPSLDSLLFFFDIEHNGYFWIFPFSKDGEQWANIGYGTSRLPAPLKQRLRDYCERPEVRRWLAGGRPVGTPIGAPLNVAPVRRGRVRPARPLFGPGFMLLGDAASLIHPLSGEGIAFALASGKLAAEVLHDPAIAEADKGSAYERRILGYVTPFFTALSTFCAIRLPVLLPRPLAELYLHGASWLQARTGWGMR